MKILFFVHRVKELDQLCTQPRSQGHNVVFVLGGVPTVRSMGFGRVLFQ